MNQEILKNILLIEDDLDIQDIIRVSLCEVGGFTLEICCSGVEAIEKVRIFPPQLVLLDVMMPVMDGITTLQKLKELPTMSHVPVIFLTAKVQPHEVASYKNKGAVDVISKPFDPMQLPEKLLSIWKASS